VSREKTIIELINKIMPMSASRLNKPFESDSEIIRYGDEKILFSIDAFSSEDMLCDRDPCILGWNLAVAGISDILASGGNPRFYAHSMVIGKDWSNDCVEAFSYGVAEVLKISQASFIGGDLGKSEDWTYTTAVIGKLEGKPLLRSGASIDESIYLSGKIGGGNLDAAVELYSGSEIYEKLTNLPMNTFQLRTAEAALIREYATSCIDTSDGVHNALDNIAEMSETGYYVENPPYMDSAVRACQLLSLPKTLLFMGECGEYELLFTIDRKHEEDFLREARIRKLKYYRIGEVRESSTRVLFEDNRAIDLSSAKISGRDYDDAETYLKNLIDWLER
jgi:thiamine-monophosphate kinase